MPYNEDFYKDFGLTNVPSRFKKKQEVYNLFKKPIKDDKQETPRFYNFKENDTHQADILYLPDDEGYKYCLVICDSATAKSDAVPLKELDSETVLDASLQIYRRGILKQPRQISVDSGSEFKGDFLKYWNGKGVFVKKALAGRHRQVALVERKNQVLGKVLFMRMFSQELLTGKVSKEWVEDLPHIVKKMNKKYEHKPYTEMELLKKFSPWESLEQNIIPLGTKVRIMLDEPRDHLERKLHGKFRDSDHRWSLEQYKVVDYVFDPLEPVLYKTDKKLMKNEKVAYTFHQLQVVPKNEDDPSPLAIRGTPETYIVKKILERRKYRGRVQYKVLWKGFKPDEATWEPISNIPKILIKDFKANNA